MPLPRAGFWLSALLLVTAMLAHGAEPVPGKTKGRSELVSLGADGRLHYSPYSSRGDTIPDFSNCGYAGGDQALPDAPVRETLSPNTDGADDSARIQAALDRVGALARDASGLRGAVLLKRGHYTCNVPLKIRASGVVLRGEGDDDHGTVLTAAMRKAEPLIQIGGASGPKEIADSRREIADDYVPVGARSFRVPSANGYAVGQTVFVVRHGNAAWIHTIGMDRIMPR